MTTPRGIRNNNPGNIRWGDPWQGLVPESQRTDPSFCQFTSAVWGIRALAKILLTYQEKYGLRTVADMIRRWAPPSENNTAAYTQAVAAHMGVLPAAPVNLADQDDLRRMVEAIIEHENGQQPYSDARITKALELAA